MTSILDLFYGIPPPDINGYLEFNFRSIVNIYSSVPDVSTNTRYAMLLSSDLHVSIIVLSWLV